MDEIMGLNKTYPHNHDDTFLYLPEMESVLSFVGKIPKTGQSNIRDARKDIWLMIPHLSLNIIA